MQTSNFQSGMKSAFLLVVSMFLIVAAQAESKKAFKLLEKEEYDKLSELLQKSMEKDSINSGAKYVYSLLYLTPKYRNYNIDTAYYFINGAIADFAVHDEKTKENLRKTDITDSTLHLQKKEVESHAFRRAVAKQTIDDYDYFLVHFDGAAQADSAVALRNQIAYDDAVRLNTYESFQYFIHTYPEAVQINMAKDNYDKLLYNTMANDHKLASYIRFLKNNPDTPFRDDAERNIFEISTAANDQDSYLQFIEQYPDSKMKRQALGFMYHRYKTRSTTEQFMNKYAILQKQDSLKRMAEADTGGLMAIFEMDKYGFSKLDGEKTIDFTYDKIKEDYYCGNIVEDFLEVEMDGEKMIISRLGDVVFKGDYDEVEDLGSGVLKISKDGKVGVYHKMGIPILGFEYEDAKVVANAFVKFKTNGKWGLKSIANRDLLTPNYDDIFSEGEFVLMENDGFFAVQNIKNIAKAADLESPKLDFKYDDYELIFATQLLLFKGDMETVVDLDLKENIPLDNQNFYELYDGWMVKKNNKYRIYDQIFYPLSDLEFDMVDANGSRAAIKYKSGWGIYNSNKEFPTTFDYDSVRFLSEQIGIIVKGDSTFAIFDNGQLLDISYSKETKLLKPTGLKSAEDDIYAQYLLTKNSKGIYKAFNIHGLELLDGKYTSVEALGHEYLVVERGGKKGLFHQSGTEALKVRYNAIGNYDRGYVSTLLDGKFGIYNYKKNVLLSAKYLKALKPFGNQYFIGTKGSSFGLVNLENKDVTGYKFDQILEWNDSVALVKEDDRWKLYDIKNDNFLFEGIDEYKVLRDDDEEKILLITKNSKSGILSNKHGEVVGATFNDIVNIGSLEHPVYFSEKYIQEAEFYVVIYYDETGKILRKQIFTEPEEYEKIYCG